jgi:pyroglutamyl-peptidase
MATPKTLLLTSFDVWLPHQLSNASDDLLVALQQRQGLSSQISQITMMRKLPVDFQQAPELVCAAIEQHHPDLVVCCGMAESRQLLEVESCGCVDQDTLVTPLDLNRLTNGLAATQISNNAGQFVCNYLYYSVMKYCHLSHPETQCLFIHVPLLTLANFTAILDDFSQLLNRLQTQNF